MTYDAPLNENPDVLINWFDAFRGANRYGFLSNFHVGEPLYVPGLDVLPAKARGFQTGEHAFQAAKAKSRKEFIRIGTASSPGESKRLGRSTALRDDWEAVKYDVMRAVINAKFSHDREEGDLLMATGSAMLVEGTFWNDRIWGVDLRHKDWPGRNWLGTMLMARRAELLAHIDVIPVMVQHSSFLGKSIQRGKWVK